MNIAPGTPFEAPADTGITGLVGTIEVGIYDGDGAVTQALASTGIIETPAGSGIYVAERTAPLLGGQYLLVWSLDGTLDPDQVFTEELEVAEAATGDIYATVDELFRILKIRTPSAEQEDAGERVLVAAAGEINAEIDLDEDAAPLSGWQLALAAQVNLERAAELWQQQEIAFGIVGLGSEFGPTRIARDTWGKHAFTLAPLKGQFGLA